MESKAKFHFASEAGPDAKSTIVKVKTIQLMDQPEIFRFPNDKQSSLHHKQLFDTNVVKNVVKSLKIRNKFRNVMITLDAELQGIYMDEEGNVAFNDEYLEEVSPLENPTKTGIQGKSTRSLAKDMIIENFNGQNFKASTWIRLFVQECIRVGITQDKYAETLRLFLTDSAVNWFNVCMKQNSLNNWELWNNSFIETFSVQSWTDIAYAYNFKYLNGSLLDFALKKRNLLMEVDDEISLNSQINLIVISLPNHIQNRIDRKTIGTIEDLMSKLKQFGYLNDRKKENNKTVPSHKQCSNCEKLGFPNRFHPENMCRLKEQKSSYKKNNNIKVVNNVDFENAVANSEEAKNE
ncbi:uncharacterized protein LOC123317753 [Coccinella septempunctata]|uniref:uncharacterized protein LOC123317753 n=1 Tax=Coccinella septempunctata TaxID=41139 RepID=UPI001D069FAD|nr:uncharacterized protein LOC123317753 [Coccinella septempunctata]